MFLRLHHKYGNRPTLINVAAISTVTVVTRRSPEEEVLISFLGAPDDGIYVKETFEQIEAMIDTATRMNHFIMTEKML